MLLEKYIFVPKRDLDPFWYSFYSYLKEEGYVNKRVHKLFKTMSKGTDVELNDFTNAGIPMEVMTNNYIRFRKGRTGIGEGPTIPKQGLISRLFPGSNSN